ncbi:regulatory protein RecX [Psittacicella gerlachiana]|uniref:Regulatory protein RecX n=1 Tax=Psittacicella gerlachiana TaxID=2028574 RepID=A0A3A1YJ15_9GAMM|nr:regulatory protein RecX [Psittacicella gerlachiana]RIY37426.1 hypothetical protein CKF59_01840 [Psittacicella gerlachiana]
MTKLHDPYEYLIYLLSRKEYSLAQLRQKLKDKGYPEEESQAALEVVVQKKYQSDARFAESFLHDQGLAGFGPQTISQKLRLKGVSEAIIQQTLEESEFNWEQQAFIYFVRKGFAQLDLQDFKVRAKMQRNMLSKGYDFSHINYCLNTCKELAELELDPETFILNNFSYEN